MRSSIQRQKVGIVGVGNVGVAAAYAMFQGRLGSDIVLVDKDLRRVEGEAMDLMHGQALVGRVNVRPGDYPDLVGAQVIVICAGVGQKPGEPRLNLLQRNVEVMRQIVRQLDQHAPDAILVIATNPVDIITYAVQKLSRRADSHIIGTGTLLDTARFRALLGRHFGVDPRSVHAYILGEHGDSEVPIWSQAFVGGVRVRDRLLGVELSAVERHQIFEQVRGAADAIIERKGYTSSAIGLVIARLVTSVLRDHKSVLPVSVPLAGDYGLDDVCLSVPCVVGIDGVEGKLLPNIEPQELLGLQSSARILTETLRAIRFGDPEHRGTGT